jgi:hypothetical protein
LKSEIDFDSNKPVLLWSYFGSDLLYKEFITDYKLSL